MNHATGIITTDKRPRGIPGFTLIELMVVITIISLLITFLLPGIFREFDRAKYAEWLTLRHDLTSDTSCVWFFAFQEDQVDQYNAPQGAAGGENETGRIYNLAKSVDPVSIVKAATQGNEADYALLINSPEFKVELPNGDPAGRLAKFKGAMILNENGGPCQGLVLEERCSTILKEGDSEFTIYLWIYPTQDQENALVARSSGYYQNGDVLPFHNAGNGNANFQMAIKNSGALELMIICNQDSSGNNIAGTVEFTPGGQTIKTNEWNFVCVRFYRGEVTVWINDQKETDTATWQANGALSLAPAISESTDAREYWKAAAPLTLGAHLFNDTVYADEVDSDSVYLLEDMKHDIGGGFVGRIGEFGAFSKALDDRKIKRIYKIGRMSD